MTFAHPSLLLGLAALAIPLAIHFLSRRRARKVFLPTARFAEGAHQAMRGRQRLKQLALLALRTAAVALLVLAVAGPRLGGAGKAPGDESWIVCLDTSPSMLAREGDTTRLEQARAAALDRLAKLPAEAQGTLVGCDE